jgi:hypothetical protein
MYALDANLSNMLGFANVEVKSRPIGGVNICLEDFTRPLNASSLLFDQRVIDQVNDFSMFLYASTAQTSGTAKSRASHCFLS